MDCFEKDGQFDTNCRFILDKTSATELMAEHCVRLSQEVHVDFSSPGACPLYLESFPQTSWLGKLVAEAQLRADAHELQVAAQELEHEARAKTINEQ